MDLNQCMLRRARCAYSWGVSVLCLMMLLSCNGVHVVHGEKNSVAQNRRDLKDQAQLHIKTPEGSKMQEDVEYDEKRKVLTVHGPDGYLLVQDLEQGLKIVKDAVASQCYVIPVATAQGLSKNMERFVKSYNGREIQTSEEKQYRAVILPGTIADTSFLPEEADTECKEYRWMTIIGENVADCEPEEKSLISGEVVIVSSRAIPLTSPLSSLHSHLSRYTRQTKTTTYKLDATFEVLGTTIKVKGTLEVTESKN